MYILNILSAGKKDDNKRTQRLLKNYLKTIVNKVDFLKKNVIVQQNIRKTDLLLLATKLIKKFMILVMLKNIWILFEDKKYRSGKAIKNKFSATKSYGTPKH